MINEQNKSCSNEPLLIPCSNSEDNGRLAGVIDMRRRQVGGADDTRGLGAAEHPDESQLGWGLRFLLGGRGRRDGTAYRQVDGILQDVAGVVGWRLPR